MQALYDQFLAVVASGDEAAAHVFLKDHLNEFPEDLQQKIVFAYFQEAVNGEAEQVENIKRTKEEGLELLKQLEAIRKEYEVAAAA